MTRLNLGCGPVHFDQNEGWVNIDFDSAYAPDVVADVRQLPFEDNSIEEVYASHLLEHFSYDEPVLEEWFRVLAKNGNITIVVPDILGVWFAWKAGYAWGSPDPKPIDLSYVNATVFGARFIDDNFIALSHEHKQIFIMDMLIERMRPLFPDVVQLSSIELPGMPRRNALPGETLVCGTKTRNRGPVFIVKGKGGKVTPEDMAARSD